MGFSGSDLVGCYILPRNQVCVMGGVRCLGAYGVEDDNGVQRLKRRAGLIAIPLRHGIRVWGAWGG